MNLILLYPDDFINAQHVRLSGRRQQHILSVHRADKDKQLRVGLLDGLMGHGVVTEITDQHITLKVSLFSDPPPQLPLTLIMALPRPKMLKRIFQTCATLGVQDLYLINSYRVEKSFWQTPWLQEDKIHEHLCLGLEQGVATQLPKVHQRKLFKPFVEDELPALTTGKRCLVAHPYRAAPCPTNSNTETLLAIGPEGGFIQYEVEKLQDAGLTSIELGPRILRVETALTSLLAKLF